MEPSLQTIVATEKNIYSLDNENDTIVSIYQFTEKAKEINFYDGGDKIIVWSDKVKLQNPHYYAGFVHVEQGFFT